MAVERRLGELLLNMGAVAIYLTSFRFIIQLNIRELFFPQFFKKYFFAFMHFFRFSVGTFPKFILCLKFFSLLGAANDGKLPST